ncbi:palmitoyltransferase ZDHHC22-like [Glandiceps talaboti]
MGSLQTIPLPSANQRLQMFGLFSKIAPWYFLTMTFIALVLGMFVTLPELFKKSPKTMNRHYAAVAYLFINAMWNYIMAIRIDTTDQKLPKEVAEYHQRKKTKPYRCHSCKLCQARILKRDHHCFFMNTCIGYYNQKYFIWYCMYMFCGTVYSIITNAMYTSRVFGTQFSGAITFFVLGPNTIYKWWFNNASSTELLFVTLMYNSLAAGIVSVGFFLWQLWLACVGLTTHEAVSDGEGFDRGLLENLRDVLGKYWLLGAVLPVYCPPSGNGIYGNKFGVVEKDNPKCNGDTSNNCDHGNCNINTSKKEK